MNLKDYKFTKEHEWFFLENGNRGKMGITDYAQSALGDVVFLDLPAPGAVLTQSQKLGEVESVKAVSDLFSPVSGKLLEVNQEAKADPKLVNEDPFGKGWLVRLELSNPRELDSLMSSGDYEKLIATLSKEK
ncbi:MAG: glycine cleavage system protein GcvH [Chloroflexota bacterium]